MFRYQIYILITEPVVRCDIMEVWHPASDVNGVLSSLDVTRRQLESHRLRIYKGYY